jgi:hypothetical protein
VWFNMWPARVATERRSELVQKKLRKKELHVELVKPAFLVELVKHAFLVQYLLVLQISRAGSVKF